MYDDDDDDQRQALGQPSLDILMLKMIVNQEFLSLFFTFKTSFYRPLFFSFIHLCNMLCMIMSCPIMPISFDVYSSKTSQCLGQSLPLRPLYRLSFF